MTRVVQLVARPIVCRPPYLPLRAKALTEAQRACVLAQWHRARVAPEGSAPVVRALSWVGTDTRDVPHVVELVVAAERTSRRLVIAAEPSVLTSADIAREWNR